MLKLSKYTDAQVKACDDLENAFKQCRAQGLAFFIMEGDTIHAFKAKDIDPYMGSGANTDMSTARRDFENFDDVRIVSNHHTIRDCGGF